MLLQYNMLTTLQYNFAEHVIVAKYNFSTNDYFLVNVNFISGAHTKIERVHNVVFLTK